MSYIKFSGVDEDIFYRLALEAKENNSIMPEYYDMYNVKRGLRNSNGTGVLVGITEIGDVRGYKLEDGKKVPRFVQTKMSGKWVVDERKEGDTTFYEVSRVHYYTEAFTIAEYKDLS